MVAQNALLRYGMPFWHCDPILPPICFPPHRPLAASSSGGAFSFGAAPAASSAASIFSFSTAAAPAFSFGGASSAAAGGDAEGAAAAPAVGGTSLFGATPASGTPLFGAAQAAPPKVELPGEQAVQTGEEDERTVFSGGWLGGARCRRTLAAVAGR